MISLRLPTICLILMAAPAAFADFPTSAPATTVEMAAKVKTYRSLAVKDLLTKSVQLLLGTRIVEEATSAAQILSDLQATNVLAASLRDMGSEWSKKEHVIDVLLSFPAIRESIFCHHLAAELRSQPDLWAGGTEESLTRAAYLRKLLMLANKSTNMGFDEATTDPKVLRSYGDGWTRLLDQSDQRMRQ